MTVKAYTIEEVVEVLKVSRRSVYNYIKTGELRAAKVGREWRVTEGELSDFLQRGTSEGYYKKLQK